MDIQQDQPVIAQQVESKPAGCEWRVRGHSPLPGQGQEIGVFPVAVPIERTKNERPPNGEGKVLVELIKTVVAPNTWCGPDATGSIVFVEHLESLAIRQTDEVFHEIDELLAATKKLAQRQRPNVRPQSDDPFE
ncbi:MAG: hypothetical protein O3C40_08520 [Planctomycetota bacterium]|nr:hypothetical protein [Planctomycetota bacterium]